MSPQEIWEGMSYGQQQLLLDSRRNGVPAFLVQGLLSGLTQPFVPLSPLGRQVAEYGRGLS